MDRFADVVLVLAIGLSVWWVWVAVLAVVVNHVKGKVKYPFFAVWSIVIFLWVLWVIVR